MLACGILRGDLRVFGWTAVNACRCFFYITLDGRRVHFSLTINSATAFYVFFV